MADGGTLACTGEATVRQQRNAGRKLRVARNGFGGVEHFRHTAAARAFIADDDGVARLNLVR